MKKLVTILLVLALAGVANASFTDDFESYANFSVIAGQNNWVTSYQEMTVVDDCIARAAVGRNGTQGLEEHWLAPGGASNGGGAARSVTGDVGTSAYSVSIEYSQFTDPSKGQGFIYAGDTTSLIGGTTNNAIWVQVYANGNIGWFQRGGATNSEFEGAGTYVRATHGWVRLQIDVTGLDSTPSALLSVIDINDGTGADIGTIASHTFNSNLPTFQAAAFRQFDQGWSSLDNFSSTPEPATLIVLSLGAGLAMLRRRR